MPTVGSLVFATWVGACGPSQAAKRDAAEQTGDAARGAKRFGEVGCNGCHLVNGVGGMIGPDLTGVASRPQREPGRWPSVATYLEESIRNPQAYLVKGFPPDMPSAEKLKLTDRDVRDLVAYLLTPAVGP